METYFVKYIHPEVGEIEQAQFSADDFDHAREQMTDYQPEVRIIQIKVERKNIPLTFKWKY